MPSHAGFIHASLLRTIETLSRVSEDVSTLDRAATLLIEAVAAGGKVMFCGNGGSAADAQHLATELVSKFRHDRPGIPALALTTDTSALTAIANDYAYDRVFARQVEALGRPGDVLVGISTSGNSRNVVEAVRAAAARGITTIGLLGNEGGALRPLVDLAIVMPSTETPHIQEAHIAIGHILCDLLEQQVVTGAAVAPPIVIRG